MKNLLIESKIVGSWVGDASLIADHIIAHAVGLANNEMARQVGYGIAKLGGR